MSATKKAQKSSRKATRKRQPKSKKPYMKVPAEDWRWAVKQKPTVYKLWGECWDSDPYGSRWMPLRTSLRGSNLKAAKKILRDAGLFDFKSEMKILEGKRYYETYVINLHGSRTTYWQEDLLNENDQGDAESDQRDAESDQGDAESDQGDAESDQVAAESDHQQPSNDAKSGCSESLINGSLTPHKRLINSSKEVMRRSCGAGERDDRRALGEGGAASVSSPEGEKAKTCLSKSDTPTKTSGKDRNSLERSKNPPPAPAPTKKSTQPANSELYLTTKGNSPGDLETLKREQKAWDEERHTEEYQEGFKELLARVRENLKRSDNLTGTNKASRELLREQALERIEQENAED